jgi:hypothetical protein
MKTLFLALPIFLSCFVSLAEGEESPSVSGRITATGPDPRKEIAKDLVNNLAAHCNSRDYIQFMDGFTDSYAGKIREKVKDAFLADDLKMFVGEVVLFSGDEQTMEFGVKYEMSVDGYVRSVTSVLTARLDGSSWKIDSEKVKKSSTRGVASSLAGAPKPRKPNIQLGGVEFEDLQPRPRQEGAVRNPPPPGWDPMNPDPNMIDPKLKDMIGLVPILPGVGCVNGKCGVQ